MPRNGRIENSEIHLATADQTNIAGRLLRWQIASRIQEGSSGSLPYPNTISCGHGSQVHSPNIYIYRHSDGRRVTIHFHPNKTYGPKLLKNLLEDISLSETELKKLKVIK